MASKSILDEYYCKGDVDVKHNDPKQDFTNVPEDTIIVKVKRGSKIKNILGFVEKSLKEEKNRYMIFTGCGDAIEKTISCVEITKTKFQGLYQISRLNALRVEEFWEPKNPDLDRLQVTREIPMISILLCKDALDSNERGYQGPKDSGHVPQRKHKRKKTDDHTSLESKEAQGKS
ncbi:ribonuclease P protein subunit p25-like protein [Parasteatoda tepidariorum]|uniref:ribonuclease P protein subunit p25-like protein n=1 Tax=Parasteatoda tepidariorum TaxID=114398 RepID=UPI00077F9600|nr:ribonuclease P protein subunit p25-like protein [Parasteatoda tepidariorum]